MENKGFFPFDKRTMSLILVVVVFAIIMFIPAVFNATTSVGTSLQFVFVNIILFAAPFLALMDALLRKGNRSKKNEGTSNNITEQRKESDND